MGMANIDNLIAARKTRNDEFYTLYEDICTELGHYAGYFSGKTVYCNCDGPDSMFYRYFADNFYKLGLKRALFTNINEHVGHALSAGGPCRFDMPGKGDFRAGYCLDLLGQADIVVTNPPFSLFREYIDVMVRHGKRFLVVGSLNAVTYKDFFPLLRRGLVWLGRSRPKKFMAPDGSLKSFGNVVWYTNLDTGKRHEPIALTTAFDSDRHVRYDNYDAVDGPRVSLVPYDYDGIIGVPVTFIEKHCPEQFEILGITLGGPLATKRYVNAVQHNLDGTTQCGNKVNLRAEILVGEKPEGRVYYTADNADGYLLSTYPRILIRRK